MPMSQLNENEDKKPLPTNGLNKLIQQPAQRADEVQSILKLTEQKVDNRLSDQNLDKSREIITLLGGAKTSLYELIQANKSLKKFFAKRRREHELTFIPEIYDEWRRLRGWDKNPHAKHHKPMVFAQYTKMYIYGRFPREILPLLEELNDFIVPGIRPARHFQYLSKSQYKRVKEFIKDVIAVAKTCNDMYEFDLKYAKQFGRPFQMSLFRDNERILGS